MLDYLFTVSLKPFCEQPEGEACKNIGNSTRGGVDLLRNLRIRALASHTSEIKGGGVHLSGVSGHCSRRSQP